MRIYPGIISIVIACVGLLILPEKAAEEIY